jgi:hypothetical protein
MRPSRSILSPQELEERRALILALLEEAPYSIGQLSALMRLHRGAVNSCLRTLAREQQVHRGADDRWRLGTREIRHERRSPDGDGQSLASLTGERAAAAAVDIKQPQNADYGTMRPTEQCDQQTAGVQGRGGKPQTVNAGDGCAVQPQQTRRRQQLQIAGSEPADAHLFDEDDASDIDEDIDDVTPALRQPRAATKMTVEAVPSWWTTAPREHFSQRATPEHKRMRTSKEARQVPLQILGERGTL